MNSAGFSSKKESVPPRWKMALLSWIAVWPTSMFVSLILKPTLGRNFPHVLAAGVVAGGIVVILYWIAMPLLMLEVAIQSALTNKGVAVVAIPGDIALKQAKYVKPSATIKACHPKVHPSEAEVEQLAKLLELGKAVTILDGARCAGPTPN